MTENNGTIKVYSTSWCPDCHRAKHILNEYGIEFTEIDVEESMEGLEYVRQVNNGNRVVPTILFPDGSILVEPSNKVLADKLGIEL